MDKYTKDRFIEFCEKFGFFKTDFGLTFKMFTNAGYHKVRLIGFNGQNCVLEILFGSRPAKKMFATPDNVMRSIRLYHDDLRYEAIQNKNQKLAVYYSKVINVDRKRLLNAGFERPVWEVTNPYGQTREGHFAYRTTKPCMLKVIVYG